MDKKKKGAYLLQTFDLGKMTKDIQNMQVYFDLKKKIESVFPKI